MKRIKGLKFAYDRKGEELKEKKLLAAPTFSDLENRQKFVDLDLLSESTKSKKLKISKLNQDTLRKMLENNKF